MARRSGDLQGLVPALGGLARLLAVDDPERARALADEAVAASGGGLGETGALLAQAWVAHAAGDVAGAREVADRAVAIARDRRDRAAVAEAVELRAALAGGDDATPVPRWPRRWPCGRSWRVRSARAGRLLALARLGGPGSADHARRAERLLRPLGARRLATAAAALASAAPATPPLAVQCLGGFAVLRDGVPVPVGEWKSRKARDLVKILIARGGRPVHRETLLDLLWPDDAARADRQPPLGGAQHGAGGPRPRPSGTPRGGTSAPTTTPCGSTARTPTSTSTASTSWRSRP